MVSVQCSGLLRFLIETSKLKYQTNKKYNTKKEPKPKNGALKY